MQYKRADARNPNMGLNNKICKNPKYLCLLHQVWLSESDVKRKHCKERPTMDMIGTRLCTNLVKKIRLKRKIIVAFTFIT